MFLSKRKLVDDYQDEPLLWRKKGSTLKASVSRILSWFTLSRPSFIVGRLYCAS